MSDYRVAKRYAKSVLELALEKKAEDKVIKDMEYITAVCQQNRSLVAALKSPVITRDKKYNILINIFKSSISEISLKLLEILNRKYREEILPEVARAYVDLYREHKGIVLASVTSAIKLPADMVKSFESAVTKKTGKTVLLDQKVDPEIIGGYILNIADEQLDNSVKSKLNTLKRELI